MVACSKADLGAKVFDSAFIIHQELDKAMCAPALSLAPDKELL